MSLSNDLISQFVKITKDSDKTKKETTAYGTAIVRDGATYVRIDGSDMDTPVKTTAGVNTGDRVTVMIKDHTAVITGNVTSPSTDKKYVNEQVGAAISTFENIVAFRVSTTDLDAVNATIERLNAQFARIGKLEAVSAEIESLQAAFASLKYVAADDIDVLNAEIDKLVATYGEFTDISTEDLEVVNAEIDVLKGYTAQFSHLYADNLTALKGSITRLETEKLSSTEAELKYANIDFSNIGELALDTFYAKSGIINKLTLEEGVVVKELVGVTIKGDLIEGGTVKADKLVVLGTDGLYYKLNFESGTFKEGEQVPEDSLHGSIITAKSITAEKVSVSDLVAFDATIGGFRITDTALYSGVKESVENTTEGVYLDSEGQMALGNSSNYIRYYKNEDGAYILEISAVDAARSDFTEQIAMAVQTCEGFIFSALDNYVENSDYSEFQESVSSRLELLANQMTLTFNQTVEHIDEINQDLQEKYNNVTKYFTFDINGLTIGQADNPYKIVIDNDRYSMYVADVEVLWIDIQSEEVHTPKLTVTNRLQMLGYKAEKSSEGHLSWDYIGDIVDNTPVVDDEGTLIYSSGPDVNDEGTLVTETTPSLTDNGTVVY